jgi:hypothetical protein
MYIFHHLLAIAAWSSGAVPCSIFVGRPRATPGCVVRLLLCISSVARLYLIRDSDLLYRILSDVYVSLLLSQSPATLRLSSRLLTFGEQACSKSSRNRLDMAWSSRGDCS